MSLAETKRFAVLERPPIVEVVCGVVFKPIAELDPLTLGIYWDSRRDDFPGRSLQPALMDEFKFSLGSGLPQRALLTSADDQFVLQIQHDRFLMNWRKRNGEYPRFSGRGGLMDRTLEELEAFEAFVSKRFGSELSMQRIELSKIDVLQRGTHWHDLDELAEILPVTGLVGQGSGAAKREINLRFVEEEEYGEHGAMTVVQLSTGVDPPRTPVALRIECNHTASLVAADLPAAFVVANAALNRAFFKLIPRDELHRFGLQGSER